MLRDYLYIFRGCSVTAGGTTFIHSEGIDKEAMRMLRNKDSTYLT
jgi:hypothetical protein